MNLTDLHKEKLQIQEKMEENEKTIARCNKDNHWLRKRIRLVDAQIEEEKENEPSNSELLDEISKGLK